VLVKEICAEYGESYSVITKRCQDGSLPAEKVNGKWDIKLEDYLSWKNRKTKNPPKEKKPLEEKIKINNKQCRKCAYGMMLTSSEWGCDYLNITGKLRGCSTYPTCEKYKPKRKKHSAKTECNL
jgi:hypothetical protein